MYYTIYIYACIAFTYILSCTGHRIEEEKEKNPKNSKKKFNNKKSKLWALNNKQVHSVSVETYMKRNEMEKEETIKAPKKMYSLSRPKTKVRCLAVLAIHRNRNTKFTTHRNYGFILILYFLGDALSLIFNLTYSVARSLHLFWSDKLWGNLLNGRRNCISRRHFAVIFLFFDFRWLPLLVNWRRVRLPTKSIHLLLWLRFRLFMMMMNTGENCATACQKKQSEMNEMPPSVVYSMQR